MAYTYWTEALGTGYWGVGAQKGGGMALAALIVLSAAVIALWRRRRMSAPEIAVYLMGVAAAFVAVLFLV